MTLITRSVHNTLTHAITLQVPGYDANKAPVTIPASTTVDLFTVLDAEQLASVQAQLAALVAAGDLTVAATADSSAVELSGTLQTVSTSTQTFSTTSVGGVSVKTYALSIDLEKPLADASTLDSNDACLKLTANNYAANDANFILRGINSGINNRSGGVLGIMDNNIGCQAKSGGTVSTISALTVHAENYGTVSSSFGGLHVVLTNEGAVATEEYGIKIENTNNSLATAVTSAVKVADTGANIGFTTGLDLNGATLVNEVVFSNGTKLTVSGDTITFTNAAGTAHSTITMAP